MMSTLSSGQETMPGRRYLRWSACGKGRHNIVAKISRLFLLVTCDLPTFCTALLYIHRHDIDPAYPRSLKEIFELNRNLVNRFERLFEDRDIPVVPSLGNNDIYRMSSPQASCSFM